MRRLLTTSLCILSLSLIAPVTASASDDQLCKTYGKIGGAMTDFMLPLTVRELVNMMSGKDPAKMSEMTQAFIGSLDGDDFTAIGSLSTADQGIFGEAAGQVAMGLLLSGQATTGDDVTRQMVSSCSRIGARNIIANQRRATAATEANMGQ